jgi:hypothetical protein
MRWHVVFSVAALVAFAAGGQTGPTVGDPVEVDLGRVAGETIEIDPPEGIEVDRETESGVVVRSFRPGPVTLEAILWSDGGEPRSITRQIEIASVLHPDDDLEPAPLSPPLPLRGNRGAWIAIAAAAVAAAAAWAWLMSTPSRGSVAERWSISPSAELIQTIEKIRRLPPSDVRIARVSDAVRQFLSRVDPSLRRSLTSAELLGRIRRRAPEPIVEEVRDILHEGDYAKFAPWGGRAGRFDVVADEARHLAVLDREEEGR